MLQAIGIGIPFNRNAAGAAVWSPLSLFSSGEQGVWYDPSDFSTMFQDSAGTTPVTAVGQPVGKILDKSGNNNHATQATSTKRPALQQDGSGKYYLEFDGVDDYLVTSVIDFSATHLISSFAGVVRNAEQTGAIFKLGTPASSWVGEVGSCLLHVEWSSTEDYYGGIGCSAGGFLNKRFGPYPATNKNVVSVNYDSNQTTGEAAIDLRINGSSGTVVGSTQLGYSATNFANKEITVARNDTAYLYGKIYSLVIRGASTSGTDLTDAETYVNSKTGAY